LTSAGLVIRSLDPADAPAVAALLAGQAEDYLRFFHVMGQDEQVVRQILEERQRDLYSGIYWQAELICVFFLRGWDAGFEIPSFGLVVDAVHRGHHVVSVAVEASKLSARLAGAQRMMIKVHPENDAGTTAAQRLGFAESHEEPDTGNIVSYMEL